MISPLQEHDLFKKNGETVGQDPRYDNLRLIQWSKPFDDKPWGYYASYRIGAEWIGKDDALIVTAKRGMENIDFLTMFMTCFSSDLAVDSFAGIYSIDTEEPTIYAPSLRSVVSPLIVIHFLTVVNRIKNLKKGYVHHQENLKKVKGHIKTLKNERCNIALKRYDRIYCEYDEYSADIPENRLLKKALVFSKALINNMTSNHSSFFKLKLMISNALAKFESVSDDVDIKSIVQIHSHKLYKEYSEALRLAKIILKHFDYSISKVSSSDGSVVPFVLDMSLLYEHFVYGLLHEAYHDKISYQYSGNTGFPDFLYRSEGYKAILDTKYIPKYENEPLDLYVVRQLSGYGRDLKILRHLGYEGLNEDSQVPPVPCIIIYPETRQTLPNPFIDKELTELCVVERGLSQFYKLSVPIPTIRK